MEAALQLAAGGLLLYFGAEWLVGGASALALLMRVPKILVGLTVVAYGTSVPEMVVGIDAARTGHGAVALGNVVGSNITNIGLILGVAALVRPAHVDRSLRQRELPVLIVSTVLLFACLLDGRVSVWEALGLLGLSLAYSTAMVRASRSPHAQREARREAEMVASVSDEAGAPRPGTKLMAAATAAVGLATLIAGGHLFVDGAVTVAKWLSISDRVVGLTIVAVGTSLPELVSSVVASRRGHSDLAIGNVVGSNIFNVLLCLSTAALAGPVGAPLAAIGVEMVALVAATLLIGVFIRSERVITRTEGGLALALYATFMVLVVRGG